MAARKASTSKKTTAAKDTSKSTTKDTQTAAKAKVERDKFGASVNSQCARINAAIGGTPQSAKEIAEKANANHSATQSHLRTLTQKELIIRTDEGYSLKVEKKATRKRTSKKS